LNKRCGLIDHFDDFGHFTLSYFFGKLTKFDDFGRKKKYRWEFRMNFFRKKIWPTMYKRTARKPYNNGSPRGAENCILESPQD